MSFSLMFLYGVLVYHIISTSTTTSILMSPRCLLKCCRFLQISVFNCHVTSSNLFHGILICHIISTSLSTSISTCLLVVYLSIAIYIDPCLQLCLHVTPNLFHGAFVNHIIFTSISTFESTGRLVVCYSIAGSTSLCL